MIDWDELERLETEQYAHLAFNALAGPFVTGEGDNPIAMIIGMAPEAQEVIKGRPFVGPAGRVLRDLMDIARLWSTDSPCDPSLPANCWLTNVVKFRPPSNRKPTPAEIAAARPYLRREWIAVGRPRVIIPVGGTALQAVTGVTLSITRVAGKLMTFPSSPDMFIWPMVHPAFGLRTPAVQPLLEKDWQALADWLRDHDFHSGE